jgi:hypothetical protein
MSADTTKSPIGDPITERLEDQIAWYDQKSLSNQRTFKGVKVVEIVSPR